MTNITTDVPMERPRRRSPGWEYALYFALIFAISLPGSVLGWAFESLRGGAAPGSGPATAALRHARTITPQIFSV